MIRCILIAFAVIFPLLVVGGYAYFLICTTAPVSALSIEKAGQFGDSFGVITCLFSGLAFSGVLVTLYLQREAYMHSVLQHQQNVRLTSLSALLSVYHNLAEIKQAELSKFLISMHYGDGQFARTLQQELDSIKQKRDRIYTELEKAAGLNVGNT